MLTMMVLDKTTFDYCFLFLLVDPVYLPNFKQSHKMREIFALSWTGFPKMSQQLPKISDDFLKASECCQKCPKMF